MTKGQYGEPWEVDREEILDCHGRPIELDHPDIRGRAVSIFNACDGGNPEAIPDLVEAAREATIAYREEMKNSRAMVPVSIAVAIVHLEKALAKWEGE